jgi:hypothetical protein
LGIPEIHEGENSVNSFFVLHSIIIISHPGVVDKGANLKILSRKTIIVSGAESRQHETHPTKEVIMV